MLGKPGLPAALAALRDFAQHDKNQKKPTLPAMFEQMPLPILSAIFAAAGIVVWIAGVYVSKTTDVLSSRFKLGEALGGAIPSRHRHKPSGNRDHSQRRDAEPARHCNGKHSRRYRDSNGRAGRARCLCDKKARAAHRHAAGLDLVLEAVFVIVMLTLVVMGHQLPDALVCTVSRPMVSSSAARGLSVFISSAKRAAIFHGKAAAMRPADNRAGRSGKKKNKTTRKNGARCGR